MIVLFTDFSVQDPYIAQVKAVLYRHSPKQIIIDLFSNLPAYNIEAAAYLLPAYVNEFPLGSVFLCIVDPGVGGERLPVILKADGYWFVGPDNGLFNLVAKRATEVEWYAITWQPESLADSFHGRDLFAPVATMLTANELPACEKLCRPGSLLKNYPDDIAKIIYIDHYGNMISGLRASTIAVESSISYNNHQLNYARVFTEVKPGELFWYKNSNGLIEFAVNQGSAEKCLAAKVGDCFSIE